MISVMRSLLISVVVTAAFASAACTGGDDLEEAAFAMTDSSAAIEAGEPAFNQGPDVMTTGGDFDEEMARGENQSAATGIP